MKKHTSLADQLLKMLADLTALWLGFILAFVASSLVVYLWEGHEYLAWNSTYATDHTWLFAFFSLATVFAFSGMDHYTERLPWWHQIRQIAWTMLIAMLVQGFMLFAWKYPLSRMWVGTTWVLGGAFLVLARILVRRYLKYKGHWGIPTVVLGGGEAVLDTLYALHSDTYADFEVKHIVILGDDTTLTPDDLPTRYRKAKVQKGMAAAEKVIQGRNVFVVLAPHETSQNDINTLMTTLNQSGNNYALVPPTFNQGFYNVPPRYFFGHDVVMFMPNQRQKRSMAKLAKRALDIAGSLALLAMLMPTVFVLIAALIKRENSSSSVVFSHKRVGQGGKMFPCYKFTSMVPNAGQVLKELLEKSPEARKEWEKDFKLKNDPRITRIGAKLRSTSLDELPQLWNVLKGEMSLVGPRPIVEAEQEYYGNKLPAYLSCKPGMTGLWQVSGRNDTSYAHRVQLDAWYATNWSVWHDIVILMETVKIVLNRSGAY